MKVLNNAVLATCAGLALTGTPAYAGFSGMTVVGPATFERTDTGFMVDLLEGFALEASSPFEGARVIDTGVLALEREGDSSFFTGQSTGLLTLNLPQNGMDGLPDIGIDISGIFEVSSFGMLTNIISTDDLVTEVQILSGSILNSSVCESRSFLNGTFFLDKGGYTVSIQTEPTLVLDPPPTSKVPAPLPVAGAVAAFGFSRKLRQRIKAAG